MKRTVLTFDGVARGLAEYGDPHGRPVVLHHGLLGDAGLPAVWNTLARDAAVRLISVDRPGYGAPDPVPMAAVGDWTAQLLPVLEACGVGAFDVLGISAGAPYAYALAAGLPERVRRVWVLSGLPYVPDDAVRGHYPEEAEPVWTFYREAPEAEVVARFAGAAQRMAEVFAGSPRCSPRCRVWPPTAGAGRPGRCGSRPARGGSSRARWRSPYGCGTHRPTRRCRSRRRRRPPRCSRRLG
ncbi:alpha/beta fold hydrolase [Streptomyces microflavus]|uniref:alpha/beta fold hydrolase n=1 Tax=Streptomyces microflavus TaxID=1919 RepID=UPI001E2EC80D|nr:alpha/beta hydrolase [Streptomyces microflavus]